MLIVSGGPGPRSSWQRPPRYPSGPFSAEEGQAVGAESLQALAGALDVAVESLRADLDEPSVREALKQARSRYAFVFLAPVRRGGDFRPFFPAEAHQVDAVDGANEEAGDAVARLEQQLKDLGDLWRDVEPIQRHEALKDLQCELDTLATLGFIVTAGSDPMRLRSPYSEQVFTMNVLRVVVAPAAEPKLFAVRDKTAPISFA